MRPADTKTDETSCCCCALSEQQGTPGAPGSVRTTHLISDGGSTFKFVCFFVLFFVLKSSEPSSPRCVRTKCLVQTRSSVVQRVQQHHGRRVLSLQLWKQKVFNTSVPARLWSLCVCSEVRRFGCGTLEDLCPLSITRNWSSFFKYMFWKQKHPDSPVYLFILTVETGRKTETRSRTEP